MRSMTHCQLRTISAMTYPIFSTVGLSSRTQDTFNEVRVIRDENVILDTNASYSYSKGRIFLRSFLNNAKPI